MRTDNRIGRDDSHHNTFALEDVAFHHGYLFGGGQCIFPSMIRMFFTLKSPLCSTSIHANPWFHFV